MDLSQAHVELRADIDDLSRSGAHSKRAIWFVGDFEIGLAGPQRDEPFALAVANRDRTIGVKVQ